MVINSASPLVIAPYSLSKIPYDVKKDFAFITLVVRVPEVVAVHPSLPANSLSELLAYAKANPGKVNFGSAGSGSITHLAGELLKSEAKIDIVHVPYKGAAPAVPDVPSTVELKYPNVTSDNWYGVIMPAATPADIQRRVHTAATNALKS